MTLNFKLVASNIELYYAWKKYFDKIPTVEVIDNDILACSADAIVSPANSFGYMDGGLDLKYSQYFGWELERKVRATLEAEYFGEIPVGQAIITETNHKKMKYLISAPTMRVPTNICNTVNAYLAFKGLIQAVLLFNKNNKTNQISSILCPGLGTGEGKMPYEQCAYQMYQAFRVCIDHEILKKGGLAGASYHHMDLLRLKT